MHLAKVTIFFSFFQSRTRAKGIRMQPAMKRPIPKGSLSVFEYYDVYDDDDTFVAEVCARMGSIEKAAIPEALLGKILSQLFSLAVWASSKEYGWTPTAWDVAVSNDPRRAIDATACICNSFIYNWQMGLLLK